MRYENQGAANDIPNWKISILVDSPTTSNPPNSMSPETSNSTHSPHGIVTTPVLASVALFTNADQGVHDANAKSALHGSGWKSIIMEEDDWMVARTERDVRRRIFLDDYGRMQCNQTSFSRVRSSG